MDHVKDLKRLRDDALGRLQSNPDYRTLRALTALIDDLTLMDSPRSSVGDIPTADAKNDQDTVSGPVAANGKGPVRVTNFASTATSATNSDG
ncbi:MAG: hypothetical protein AAF141_16060 [Pseudomonadota bacterium]